MMKNLAQIAAPILLTAIAACDQTQIATESSKPVELTADQEVSQLVERGEGRACAHDAVLNDIRQLATQDLSFSQDDAWNGGWSETSISKFESAFKSQFDRIVLNAHDPTAALVSCSAEYTASIDGESFSTSIDYMVRLTVDREPLIEMTDVSQLKYSARRAQHLFYCEQIYPEQVQRHGTPYAIVCTLDELERVPASSLRKSATHKPAETTIDHPVRDVDRRPLKKTSGPSDLGAVSSQPNDSSFRSEHRPTPR